MIYSKILNDFVLAFLPKNGAKVRKKGQICKLHFAKWAFLYIFRQLILMRVR